MKMKMVRKAVTAMKILMRAMMWKLMKMMKMMKMMTMMKMAQLQGRVKRRSEPNTANSKPGSANSVVWFTIRKPKIMGSVQQNAAINREAPRRKGNVQAPLRQNRHSRKHKHLNLRSQVVF